MIAIRDFKMPENCIKCPMQFGGWCYVSPSDVDERVAPTVDDAVEQGKPEWCPLVDVPDMNVGKCSEIPNNSDCVSRQAAIDAVSNCGICIQRIVDLPSAQPEIIHCKDCKHWIDKSCESDDMWMSMYEDVSAFTRFNTDEDFFCRFAERRWKDERSD